MPKPSRKHHNPNFDAEAAAAAATLPWEVVWRGVAESEASIIAGSLEADGIRAQVEGVRREYGLLAGSFDHGDYSVFVPHAHAEQARALLSNRGEAKNVIDPAAGDDPDYASALRFVAAGILVLALFIIIFYLANR